MTRFERSITLEQNVFYYVLFNLYKLVNYA